MLLPIRFALTDANAPKIASRSHLEWHPARAHQSGLPDPIIWAMLNAIKEQEQEIRTLRKRAVRLESKLTALQKQRGQIEAAWVK